MSLLAILVVLALIVAALPPLVLGGALLLGRPIRERSSVLAAELQSILMLALGLALTLAHTTSGRGATDVRLPPHSISADINGCPCCWSIGRRSPISASCASCIRPSSASRPPQFIASLTLRATDSSSRCSPSHCSRHRSPEISTCSSSVGSWLACAACS